MNIECITAWRTTDGKIFDNIKDAEKHQKKLNFIYWLDREQFIHFAKDITSEDICIWLEKNKHFILGVF